MSYSKYIADFVKAVYPESTELCMTVNSEKECLQDATKLITELQAENARLREALEKIEDTDIAKYQRKWMAFYELRLIAKRALKGGNDA